MAETALSKSNLDPSVRQWLEWAQQNSRLLSLGGFVLAAAILDTFLFIRSGQIKSVRAEESYNESQQLFYSGKAPEGALKMAETARRYAGTNAGTMAAMRLAVIRINDRKMGEAISVLKEAQPKAKKVFSGPIHGLLAAAYSDSGLFRQAAEEYALAAEGTRVESEKAELSYRSAEMFALSGNKDRAVQMLKVLSVGPPSELRGKARKLVGELTTVPAKIGG
jgi:tetratricopeptide (TPR) repeat protein